jgi:hypothetical protein
VSQDSFSFFFFLPVDPCVLAESSVAILPSAVFSERLSLGARWVLFSFQSFWACGPRKLMKIT